MAGLPQVTIVGTLTDDPELRFTASGDAVANFSVAANNRVRDRDSGEWKDGDATFLRCSVWRQYAENVAESLTKGTRVIVTGRIKQRSYETAQGEKRTVFEVDVDDIGPALQWATATVTKANRGGGSGGGGGNTGGGSGRAVANDDPWSTPAGAGSDEPPF